MQQFLLSGVIKDEVVFLPVENLYYKEINIKFPKQLSVIFLVLFQLAFGIGHFVLGSLLDPAAAILAIIAAIFYLLGR